ncbi:MAG: hypothetical protein E4H44_05265, partial [Candidatus Aminicenantes bacterium]
HDGFALFKSKASSYNVVDATPFKRDIIGELAAACDRQGLRFGVYYSQAQDWHHPDAAGNTWDWPDESKKDFRLFLDEKVFPQVDELLSNYGRMSVLWFDTPVKITAEQSRELLAFVRAKQPECIVNSRLGPGDRFRRCGDPRGFTRLLALRSLVGVGHRYREVHRLRRVRQGLQDGEQRAARAVLLPYLGGALPPAGERHRAPVRRFTQRRLQRFPGALPRR